MNINWLLLSLFFFASNLMLSAQKEFLVCSDETRPVDGLSSCYDACLLCDVDGFTYRNVQAATVRHDDECAGGANEYFAFVAMTEFITFNITLSDCQAVNTNPDAESEKRTVFTWFNATEAACDRTLNGEGQIIGVIDCSVGTNREIEEGDTREFTNTVPLVVGQVYYFGLSSIGQTVCTNEIRITAGSTALPELTGVALSGPDDICVGAESNYAAETSVFVPLTRYTFTLNGDTLSSGMQDTLDIAWDIPGSYNLCVTADNLCSGQVTECRTITVSEPTQRDSTIYLCFDDCFLLSAADEVCVAGTYLRERIDMAGCVETIRYNVVSIIPDTTRLVAAICSGDSLSYQQVVYDSPGVYSRTFIGEEGCDSIVLLNVSFIACALSTNLSYQNPSCHDTTDGSLTFSSLSGAPPFTYTATSLGAPVSFQGPIPALGEEVTLGDLPGGTYLVNISDGFGSMGILTAELVPPAPLTLLEETSGYGDFTNSCADSDDGAISLVPAGGNPPYTTAWASSFATGVERTGLLAGNYPYTVMDASGCAQSGVVTLSAPPPLSFRAEARDETCEAIATGSISTSMVAGGTSPYAFSLIGNGSTFSHPFDALVADTYRLVLTDENGCEVDTLLDIQRPLQPSVSINTNATVVELGEEISLNAFGDDIGTLLWSGEDDFSCDSCFYTVLKPLRSTIVTARAISNDGCIAVDSVSITVASEYPNYFPNAFSPNGDGVNDVFYPHAGRASERLLWFRINDRWGGVVFERQDLDLPASPADGWDGNVRGQAAGSGVYLWSAEILHIDGKSRRLSGVVNLIR